MGRGKAVREDQEITDAEGTPRIRSMVLWAWMAAAVLLELQRLGVPRRENLLDDQYVLPRKNNRDLPGEPQRARDGQEREHHNREKTERGG